MDTSLRQRISRMGGHAVHAKYGSEQVVAQAHKGFMAKFQNYADPEQALKAHMAGLTYLRLKKRAAAKAAAEQGGEK